MPHPWCEHCGSRNHESYDCSRQKDTYTPTSEDLASVAPTPPVAADPVEPEKPQAPEPTFEAPRWPGGPEICTAENRPAFATEADLKAYHERYCPRGLVTRIWKCEKCEQLHYIAVPPHGDKPISRLPENFIPFVRKKRVIEFSTPELPKREIKETKKEPKKSVDPTTKRPTIVKGQSDLFGCVKK